MGIRPTIILEAFEATFPKRKKSATVRERERGTLTMSEGEGGSATTIKREAVTIFCSSHSDKNALFRWPVN